MKPTFEIEASQLFSESSIWKLNRDYYQKEGIDAWRNEEVPHQMTCNSMVGKTYAELIFGLLRDIAHKNNTTEIVYILELGAGTGRLAYHILKHLEKITSKLNIILPPYCYIVSDIVEDSLSFYETHPQFKDFLEKGLMDVCHFDAIGSEELNLRYHKRKINSQSLQQPLVVISNYFFDSIPTDLFHIQNQTISTCSVSLHSKENPKDMQEKDLIENLQLKFEKKQLEKPFYQEAIYNDLLEEYQEIIINSHLFFPKKSFQCLTNLQALSQQGIMVISMDKGFHEIQDLQKKGEPELIAHGSFSIWVNYHAFIQFCQKLGGTSFFPEYSTFHLQVGCLMFFADSETYKETKASYQNHINIFGPDDFNSIKKFTYKNISKIHLKELLAFIRLSQYDSTLFKNILPRLKQLIKYITVNERKRLEETMQEVWDMYFSINESFDLAYELGGICYDLGFYQKALQYFDHSVNLFGQKPDVYYNQALCYYQLKEDDIFITMKTKGKQLFPEYLQLHHLDRLDLSDTP